MASSIPLPPLGKARTVKGVFSRETSIRITIQAAPSVIWALLTNASGFPRWNSTVLSLEGEIKLGEHIKLTSILAPKRSFKLKVSEMEPEKRLVWEDAQGRRVYTLTLMEQGTVLFSMVEKIGGLLFPLYANYIPSFDKTFEQFAADLKKQAEATAHNNQ
ncbi:SRPBCC domain-containing protein [Rhodocytophaga aerolata]|uniref:SRPBCC domain-containing protein n=1 Tax=Rhodocytophaga aerolata TaxID=455078 RepID=A0ABT8RFE1_9BACT|nr:SRPBCC domain-containing protein [Rhodocytophaga aerolata]MDO1449903.1 SRPBCC domain-containing protein [Rhodocytophaga aerolata]